MESIIIIDSEDEEPSTKSAETVANSENKMIKRKHDDVAVQNNHNNKKFRRVTPTKVADINPNRPGTSSDLNGNEIDDIDQVLDLSLETQVNEDGLPEIDLLLPQSPSQESKENGKSSINNKVKPPPRIEKTEINESFKQFLEACRKADQSSDMEKFINNKLIRYYQSVHPDFVNSKSFTKTVKKTTQDIISTPKHAWAYLKDIVEELNIRRKSRHTVITNEQVAGPSGDAKKDQRLKKLNKTLWILKKKIELLEQSEIDLNGNDEYSDYIKVERFKKRACEIYNKICELTGESKHAERITKKPIVFKETAYEQFNKLLQKLVNNGNTFPDYHDVLKTLDYCDKQHNFKLKKDEKERIAQKAFEKLGKTLQKRRQNDLYDTAEYFVGKERQPEQSDPDLKMKLEENKKYHARMSEIIDKYAEKQENNLGGEEEEEEEPKSRANSKSPKATSSSCKIEIEAGEPSNIERTIKKPSEEPSINEEPSTSKVPQNNQNEISVVATVDAIEKIASIEKDTTNAIECSTIQKVETSLNDDDDIIFLS